MVRTIVTYAATVGSAIGRDYIAPGVLEAIGIVPRHEFVPEDVQHHAYADRPLPIGYGQTTFRSLGSRRPATLAADVTS